MNRLYHRGIPTLLLVVSLAGPLVAQEPPEGAEHLNLEFTPHWQVGSTWQVEYSYRQPSEEMTPGAVGPPIAVIYTYEIVAQDEIGVDGVFVVEATSEHPLGGTYRIYYRAKDFTVRRVEQVSDGGARELGPPGRGETFMDDRLIRPILLDHPRFPVESRDHERRSEGRYPITEHYAFQDGSMTVTLTRSDARVEKADALVVTQKWEPGRLFWSEAERRSGQTVLLTGRLLSD